MPKNYLIHILFFIIASLFAGCKNEVNVKLHRSGSLVAGLAEVQLIKTFPTTGAGSVSSLLIRSLGEEGATVTLYKDALCSLSWGISEIVDANEVANFTLSLSQFGNQIVYAKQTLGDKSSFCSTAFLTYSYLPEAPTSLALLALSSPGSEPNPIIEADGILFGATVNFYTDSSCSAPSFVFSTVEDGYKAQAQLSLVSAGDYEYYASQSVGGISSACSSVFVSYVYRTSCALEDLTNAPFARGVGSSTDPYIICTPAQFNSIGADSAFFDDSFLLASDIDLSSYNFTNYKIIGEVLSCSDASMPFSGTFDGGGFTVSNLSLIDPLNSYLGLFGCVTGIVRNTNFENIILEGTDRLALIIDAGKKERAKAVISNLHYKSGDIKGDSNLGGIVATGRNLRIENSSTEITIIATGNIIGGIIGQIEDGEVLNNESKSNIHSTSLRTDSALTSADLGGIVGWSENSIIKNNTSSGNLKGDRNVGGISGYLDGSFFESNLSRTLISMNGGNEAEAHGGLAGYVNNSITNSNRFDGTVSGRNEVSAGYGYLEASKIQGDYTSGTITSTEDRIGGIVGRCFNSNISKVHSDASLTNHWWALGGLVGYLEESTLENSYFSGTVTSDEANHMGGVVGVSDNSTMINNYSSGITASWAKGFLGSDAGGSVIQNNYYASATAAFASARLGPGVIEAKTDLELKTLSTFVNWNFGLIWKFVVGEYPTLQNSRIPGTFYISPTGNDSNPGTELLPWKSLAMAGSEVMAGDTIILRGGIYNERLVIKNSGNESAGPIIFKNYPGELPILDGSTMTLPSGDSYGLVEGYNISYVTVEGLELRNAKTTLDDTTPMGVYFAGRGSHITIKKLVIHEIENNHINGNAHGILIAGNQAVSMSQITIEENRLYNLILGWSESVSLNGNVENFLVTKNTIYNNNNIAIDAIGYEETCPLSVCIPEMDRARNGVISQNIIYDISSKDNPVYEGESSAVGIYVDGGKDIVIEKNMIRTSDFGIELSSEKENGNYYADNIIVRNNIVTGNSNGGLALGGYTPTRKGCRNCSIVNNTFYHNNKLYLIDQSEGSFGEVYFQNNNVDTIFKNNIFFATTTADFFVMENTTNAGLMFYNNLYFSLGPNPRWRINNVNINSWMAFQMAGNEETGYYIDPQLNDPDNHNFTLLYVEEKAGKSPAKDRGDNLPLMLRGALDFLGNSRISGLGIDIGAIEDQ